MASGAHPRRLGQALAHLHGAAAEPDVGTVGTELDGFGLSTEALEEFNHVGYVIVPTNLSQEFCDGFYAAAEAQAEAQKKPTELTFAQRIKPENQDAANARGEAPSFARRAAAPRAPRCSQGRCSQGRVGAPR